MSEEYRKETGVEAGNDAPGRFSGFEDFFNRTLGGGDSKLSWGLVLLIAFALYALVNLVVIVLRIFN